MFKYFFRQQSCFLNQSGFNLGDSCINQLVAISNSWYFLKFLMVDLKEKTFYLIFLKHSTKYDMRDLSLNYVVIVESR